MVSPRFRIVALIVTLLLAALLVVVVRLTLNTARPLAATPAPRAPATSTPAVDATPVAAAASTEETVVASATDASIAAEQPTDVPGGGFAYRAPAGFTITTGDSSVTLTGSSGSADLTPIFLLSGGPTNQFVTLESDTPDALTLDELFATFVDFFAEQDNFAVDNRRTITVDGAPARSVDLVGSQGDVPFAGRIVMAQPQPDHLFVMTGVAPLTEWQETAAAQFDTVLGSVALEQAGLLTAATPNAADAESATSFLLPTPTPTARPAPTLPPTPTSIPISQPLPTPDPDATVEAKLTSYTNANQVRDLALTNTAVWAATEGGIVAWNHGGGFVKFSIDNGLALNHFNTVAYCPLPGFGIVFGTDGGLQIFDTRTGTWNTLNSTNSAMSFDDVSVVECSPDEGFLTVGYRQHGLDLFDAENNAWTYLDRTDGLADNFVDQVAVVGEREEIWVASGFSLTVVSNGRSVTHTSGNSPLQGAPINALEADDDGTVWVMQPAALHAIRDQEWTTYSAGAGGATTFPQGPLTALTLGEETIWLGTATGEVCRFNSAQARCDDLFRDVEGLPPLPVTALAVTDEQLYVATNGGGVSLYDGATWRQRELPGEVLLDNRVRTLAQDANGFIWIATGQGVQQMNPLDAAVARARRFGTTAMPLDAAQSMSADFVGGVWFGGLGAAYFDEDEMWTVYTAVDGLAGNVVQAIAVDPQFRVWLGAKNGLSIWNGETFFNLTRENGLPSENILALLPQGDAMWIGSNGGGLYRFAANQLRIFNRADTNLPSDTVTALAEAADGAILVGTDQGLFRFRDETVESIPEVPALPITAIATDGPRIWVATDGDGLYTYDGRAWRQRRINGDLPSLSINALLVDQYGTLWIGGESGGIVREPIPGQ